MVIDNRDPPEDYGALDAVTQWVGETVDALDSKGAQHITIPLAMMRTLLSGVTHATVEAVRVDVTSGTAARDSTGRPGVAYSMTRVADKP